MASGVEVARTKPSREKADRRLETRFKRSELETRFKCSESKATAAGFKSKKTIVLLTLLCSFGLAAGQEEEPLEFDDIVDQATYDKMRPPKPEGKPTMVSFHVTVMSLDTIDEGSMTYAADVFFAQEWKDNRLILPNMTREYRLLPVEWLSMVWRPDSFFKNAKRVTFQTMTIPNHYLWLYKDKTILYMVKLTLLLSCAMHFENYPHDEQICRMSMESLSHTTDDLVFVWLPEDKTPLAVDDGIELPQLELVSNITGDCTSVYSTGNFTCLEVIFKFRRRLGYYLFHTYMPTCIIVMMSWISFWIKPEAVPARVTLGVTSLLTLSTQHANSQKSLPPVSYIKAIDIFMASCTVFVFLTLIEYAFVNIMMGDISEVERKDKTSHLRNIIVTANSRIPAPPRSYKDSIASSSHHQRPFHDRCPKHRGTAMQRSTSSDDVITYGMEAEAAEHIMMKEASSTVETTLGPRTGMENSSHVLPTIFGRSDQSGNGRNHGGFHSAMPFVSSASKKYDPKEIMKRHRERAICIDRVSRVIFPSTFILLNIIYWLVYSEILEAIKSTAGLGSDDKGH